MQDIEEKVEGVHETYKRALSHIVSHQLQSRSDHKVFAHTFEQLFEDRWDRRLEQLLIKRNKKTLQTEIHIELLNIQHHLQQARKLGQQKNAKENYNAIRAMVHQWAQALGGLVALINTLTIFPNANTNEIDLSHYHHLIKNIYRELKDSVLGAHYIHTMIESDMKHFTESKEDKKIVKEFLHHFNENLADKIFSHHAA